MADGGARRTIILSIVSIHDFKGGNPPEWPAHRRVQFPAILFFCLMQFAAIRLVATEPIAAAHFDVRSYVVNGSLLPDTNSLAAIFSTHTGADIDVQEMALAAADLQSEYRRQGFPAASIAIAPEQITNGVVTLNVFQAAFPQIVISGSRYIVLGEKQEAISNPPPAATVAAITNAAPVKPVVRHPLIPATPEEMASSRNALLEKIAALDASEKDKRIHVVSTNAGPRFAVQKYLIMGNSVLPPSAIAMTLTNIDGDFGTNVSFDGIRAAVAELQGAYRERGYVTVSVGLPQQKLTNATVKLQVTEGRLAEIDVKGNRYFSSNNVMRALPSLHTGMLLNGPVFQAELNRANANQDRQIYPVIGSGAEPGESELTLKVKDRFPLHAKLELNNQSSPGTPDMRLNASAIYDNLWQEEHSLGVQYGFSPQDSKTVAPPGNKPGAGWNFYDEPLVANYSMFYRMPMGKPEPVEKIVANNPDDFGYSEATRQFRVPPPSGRPSLTVFASRATIDTGLESLSTETLYNENGNTLTEQDVQQDLTVNNDLGLRLSIPVKSTADFQSTFSGGFDYKTYALTSYKTNLFVLNGAEVDYENPGNPTTNVVGSTDISPVPTTIRDIEYLPLTLRYDGTLRDTIGATTFGLGINANAWHSGSTSNLQNITGSSKSTGYWIILNPSLTQVIAPNPDWPLTVRADGQWASEPLISNEQFGAGGVNSVRGYREGEVFGDNGWHVSFEQETPPYVVGVVYADAPLTVRGSIYMDYARTYLLDPQGRQPGVALWGTGFGGVATIGSHWEARLLFSLPLVGTATTEIYEPFFNFSLTAQF
jgi:hemolysin activation/secretion protein